MERTSGDPLDGYHVALARHERPIVARPHVVRLQSCTHTHTHTSTFIALGMSLL